MKLTGTIGCGNTLIGDLYVSLDPPSEFKAGTKVVIVDAELFSRIKEALGTGLMFSKIGIESLSTNDPSRKSALIIQRVINEL